MGESWPSLSWPSLSRQRACPTLHEPPQPTKGGGISKELDGIWAIVINVRVLIYINLCFSHKLITKDGPFAVFKSSWLRWNASIECSALSYATNSLRIAFYPSGCLAHLEATSPDQRNLWRKPSNYLPFEGYSWIPIFLLWHVYLNFLSLGSVGRWKRRQGNKVEATSRPAIAQGTVLGSSRPNVAIASPCRQCSWLSWFASVLIYT